MFMYDFPCFDKVIHDNVIEEPGFRNIQNLQLFHLDYWEEPEVLQNFAQNYPRLWKNPFLVLH